jgi:hypothetical protein
MRLVLALALGIAGCSSTDATNSGDVGSQGAIDAAVGSGSSVAQGCRYDDECGAGQVCDGAGSCTAGNACDQDFNCQTGERCEDRTCRRARPLCAPCSAAAQCGLDLVSGLANPCVTQGDRRVCALESSARECPAGLVRDPGGYCLPAQCGTPMGCTEDADCPQGLLCAQRRGEPGLCLAFCRIDSDCPDQGTCDAVTGMCRPRCEVGSCPSNQNCHDDGRCGPGCGGDEDCAEGFSCREERCRLPGCSSDSDCPPRFGIYCDTDSRECREGCLTDQHCSSMQICREGQCATRPCRTKELDCGLGQFCCANGLDDSGQACPEGVEQGACFDFPDGYCAACQDSDDCSPEQRHGSDTLCIDYQDRDGNSLGKACALGCRDVRDCPRGFSCNELEDDQGNPAGAICTATLCVTGELEQR